jgi:chorismate mutase
MTDDALKSYRESIDNIDAALVFLLAERFKVTKAVGRHKAASGLPAADPGREAAQIPISPRNSCASSSTR